jgi:hypothetical protein
MSAADDIVAEAAMIYHEYLAAQRQILSTAALMVLMAKL